MQYISFNGSILQKVIKFHFLHIRMVTYDKTGIVKVNWISESREDNNTDCDQSIQQVKPDTFSNKKLAFAQA